MFPTRSPLVRLWLSASRVRSPMASRSHMAYRGHDVQNQPLRSPPRPRTRKDGEELLQDLRTAPAFKVRSKSPRDMIWSHEHDSYNSDPATSPWRRRRFLLRWTSSGRWHWGTSSLSPNPLAYIRQSAVIHPS